MYMHVCTWPSDPGIQGFVWCCIICHSSGPPIQAPLVQQLLSLYRSSARALGALVRTATQLRPAEAASYTKHLSQCREVCGAFKQLACASLELGVGSQQMTDEVVKRMEVCTYIRTYTHDPVTLTVCTLCVSNLIYAVLFRLYLFLVYVCMYVCMYNTIYVLPHVRTFIRVLFESWCDTGLCCEG